MAYNIISTLTNLFTKSIFFKDANLLEEKNEDTIHELNKSEPMECADNISFVTEQVDCNDTENDNIDLKNNDIVIYDFVISMDNDYADDIMPYYTKSEWLLNFLNRNINNSSTKHLETYCMYDTRDIPNEIMTLEEEIELKNYILKSDITVVNRKTYQLFNKYIFEIECSETIVKDKKGKTKYIMGGTRLINVTRKA